MSKTNETIYIHVDTASGIDDCVIGLSGKEERPLKSMKAARELADKLNMEAVFIVDGVREMSKTKVGGFMGIKSTTKSTAEFVNEQIAINDEIRELKKDIKRLTKHIKNLYELQDVKVWDDE